MKNSYPKEISNKFPNHEIIWEEIYLRLHQGVQQFNFIYSPFLLFLNLPNSMAEAKERSNFPWKYAGVNQMFKCLPAHQGNFDELKEKFSQALVEGNISKKLKKAFEDGLLDLKKVFEISTGKLSWYFSDQNIKSKNQGIENELLNSIFDINEYYFFSIPLIAFGEFIGAMHIVCHEKDFQNTCQNCKGTFDPWVFDLIKNSCYWVESVLLDWEQLEKIEKKEIRLPIIEFVSESIQNVIDNNFPEENYKNPIFKEIITQIYKHREANLELWRDNSINIIEKEKKVSIYPDLKPLPSIRLINEIPRPNKFYDLSYNRFYHALKRFDFLKERFILFITAIPRTKSVTKVRNAPKEMKYVGIDEMFNKIKRDFFEELKHKKHKLDEIKIEFRKANVKTGAISSEFEKDDLSLDDIPERTTDTLKNYFKNHQGEANPKIEKELFECCIDINSYYFISVPLIMFGEFDGAVHIIYHKNDNSTIWGENAEKAKDNSNIKLISSRLIKIFSYEIEGVLLDWESIGDRFRETSTAQAIVEEVTSDHFKKRLKDEPNRIFEELSYSDYYLENIDYYEQRFNQSRELLQEFYKRSLRNAVIAILIDSYAHNVSAHGLTSLNWWFKLRVREREEFWKKRDNLIPKLKEIQEYGITELKEKTPEHKKIMFFFTELNDLWAKDAPNAKSVNYIIDYPRSLTREIQPMFNYLMEKGAFWGGIGREEHYGGTVIDLYTLLWKDFIDNPLFLGTISRTEGVRKIKLKVIIYEPAKQLMKSTGNILKKIKKNGSGILAEINIKESRDTDSKEIDSETETIQLVFSNGTRLKFESHQIDEVEKIKEELKNRSKFLQPGPEYLHLRHKLEKIKFFLPGGVVGKHALYTILENELRNIKHYTKNREQLENIIENGLTLAISIQPIPLYHSKEYPIYQIGIWLDEPNDLKKQPYKDCETTLLHQKYHSLIEDIVDPISKRPRLGGNYQDKICAAFLFNNDFQSVQNGSGNSLFNPNKNLNSLNVWEEEQSEIDKGTISDRDKIFYPWIIPATSPYENTKKNAIDDYQVWNVGGVNNDTREWHQIYSYPHVGEEIPSKGYIKKLFHLWSGAVLKLISYQDLERNISWENLSRFKFLCLNGIPGHSNELSILRRAGVIRILDKSPKHLVRLQPEFSNSHLISLFAYLEWFKIWFEEKRLNVLINEIEENNESDNIVQRKMANYIISFNSDDIENPLIVIRKKNTGEVDNFIEFDLTHGREDFIPNTVRYRSHGIYNRYYKVEDDWNSTISDLIDFDEGVLSNSEIVLDNASKNPVDIKEINLITKQGELLARAAEFLETMATKVVIFDNRARHRIRENDQKAGQLDFFREKLGIAIFSEKKKEWDSRKEEYLKKSQFLVLHLTFIEEMVLNNPDFQNLPVDEQVMLGFLMEQEILPCVGNRDNFIFVVTTGRGRTKWWTDLLGSEKYKKYASKITFRPIESILTAIENGQSMIDDFELKHGILKVLFGS